MPGDRKATDLDAALAELTPERIERNQRIYADVVAKYYGDPDFKAEMDADPAGCSRTKVSTFRRGPPSSCCSIRTSSCTSCCPSPPIDPEPPG